ncbi:hypothetical protein ACFLSI_03755 [Bacteroidota bacterium]
MSYLFKITLSGFILIVLSIICIITPYRIIEATSQDWAGGRPEAGYGTYYKLRIIVFTGSEKLYIDQFWVGDDYYEIKPYINPGQFKNNYFSKGDTIRIQATKYSGSDITKDKNIQKSSNKYIAPPNNYKGEAIIGYKYRNKRKYKKIKFFKKLKKLNYQ